MKKNYKKLWVVLLPLVALFSSCIDQNMNVDPSNANIDQMEPEWFLNGSIGGAQMDPNISQRISSLTWKPAARQVRDGGEGFSIGDEDDSYMTAYLSNSYAVGWLRDANYAINLSKKKMKTTTISYYKNLYQMSRIWRDYLLTEMADGVGPIPLGGFNGENPTYNTVQEIYHFVLADLKDASEHIDPKLDMTGYDKNLDLFYGYDRKFSFEEEMTNWQRFANSLRMRFAMRLSEVEPDVARSNFEDAVKTGLYINNLSSIAEVPENDGYNPFKSILGYEYDHLGVTKTFVNIISGLGGCDYQFSNPQEADTLKQYLLNPYTDLGIKLDKNLSLNTNDPTTPYFFNGIPKYCDPRTSVLFDLPFVGDDRYPANVGSFKMTSHPSNVVLTYEDDRDPKKVVIDTAKFNIRGTFGTAPDGEYSADINKKSANLFGYVTPFPAISNYFRQNNLARVFYGAWESDFLLAEAKLRGWDVPNTDQWYYEDGIKQNFDYYDNDQYVSRVNPIKITPFLSQYLQSTDYNRVGTSVAYNHTAEATPVDLHYTSIYKGVPNGTVHYTYPKNSIYRNGQFNNDKLTKIITQKYIAQMPYISLEPWNDFRRLGLPFFETPCSDIDYPQDYVAISKGTKDCRWEYFPQRFRYPSKLRSQDPTGYQDAVSKLHGADHIRTAIWWSGEANHK